MVRSSGGGADGRIVVIPVFKNAFAELHVSEPPSNTTKVPLVGADPTITLYQVNEYGVRNDEGDIYGHRKLRRQK